MYLDHLAGREEAAAEALLQGAEADGLAETGDVGHVLRPLRCRGEAGPGGRGKLFQYVAPCRIVCGAAPVAFIDRDRVEKAGRELPVRLRVCLRPGDRPIESGTDLEGRVDAALPVDGPRPVDPAAVVAFGLAV